MKQARDLACRYGTRILVAATPRHAAAWRDHLHDWDEVLEVTDFQSLGNQLRTGSADAALLSLDLPRLDSLEVLHALLSAHADTRFLVVGSRDMDEAAVPLISAGAWGYIREDHLDQQLDDALDAIRNGEIWPPRKLLSQLVTDHTQHLPDVAHKHLTPREQEIAVLISRGLCQKDIAHALSISPHTVRNHTRNIYRKMDVNDRVQLSLKMQGA